MLRAAYKAYQDGAIPDIAELFISNPPAHQMERSLYIKTPRKIIKPASQNQADYMTALKDIETSIVAGEGEAGTGKTFLAVGAGLEAVFGKNPTHSHLILIRPAVTVDEDLGAVPGDLIDKLAPFIRPFHEKFGELFSQVDLLKHLYIHTAQNPIPEEKTIEFATVGHMRGRNLMNAFVIVDEAQGLTKNQLIMLMTRLHVTSKMIIIGDPEQTDIEPELIDGVWINPLADLVDRFAGDKGFGCFALTDADQRRNPLITTINKGYERKIPAQARSTNRAIREQRIPHPR
jgi:phosphate starvation-inducible PhoH-like protein